MKRCSKCILPETIPNITFSNNGVCNYCLEFEQSYKESDFNFKRLEGQFAKIIDQAKKNSKKLKSKYDILVPISGGRDSSYLAWKLAKEYKLRVLCANYKNPYTSKQAEINVKNLVKSIGADLEIFEYPRHIHERSFENNMKAWLKRPEMGSLGLICLACKPMYLWFYQIAHRDKISLIIDGSNVFEVTTFKMEAQGGKGNKSFLTPNTLIKFFKRVISNIAYLKPCNLGPAIWTIMGLNGNTPYLKWRYPNISKIGYFYFFPYNEKEINETLNKIGWKKADDNKSPWRFDCEIDSVKNYIYERLIKATEKDDLFSKNIRYGLMTRAEALQRLNEAEVNASIVEKILNSINIDIRVLDKACAEGKKRMKV